MQFWMMAVPIYISNKATRAPFLHIFLKSILKDFIYLFLERGREGEREKHQCVVASRTPATGDLACIPGMCPD